MTPDTRNFSFGIEKIFAYKLGPVDNHLYQKSVPQLETRTVMLEEEKVNLVNSFCYPFSPISASSPGSER
jgi:hypothetical protein